MHVVNTLREADIRKDMTVAEIREGGYPVGALREAGYPASQLRAAGYLAGALRKGNHYSIQDIFDAKYRAEELHPPEFPRSSEMQQKLVQAGYTLGDLKRAGWPIDGLMDDWCS